MDKTRAVKSHLNGCGLAFYLRCDKGASSAKYTLAARGGLISASASNDRFAYDLGASCWINKYSSK